MDYLLEQLGDERFQELCQALLAKSNPEVECLPVSQPDGGRDAISYRLRHRLQGRPFVVFQVKFVRKPHSIKDPHKWIIDVVKSEAPIIANLIPKGASAFYLLTNVPGTAHPDVGSIDLV